MSSSVGGWRRFDQAEVVGIHGEEDPQQAGAGTVEAKLIGGAAGALEMREPGQQMAVQQRCLLVEPLFAQVGAGGFGGANDDCPSDPVRPPDGRPVVGIWR